MTDANRPALTVEQVPIAQLAAHPDNPRRGNVEVIAESLATSGQYRPIVASRATGHVLAGNHTLRAAIKLGWSTIAVTWLDDLTPAAERRIMLADNRTAELGDTDTDLLLANLQALIEDEDLTGTGYDLDDFDDLAAQLDQTPEVAAPETDAEYNETPDEADSRKQRLDNRQTLSGQGLAEVVLVVTVEKRDQLMAWVDRLRHAWGPDLTNGEVVHAALARQVEGVTAAPLTTRTGDAR